MRPSRWRCRPTGCGARAAVTSRMPMPTTNVGSWRRSRRRRRCSTIGSLIRRRSRSLASRWAGSERSGWGRNTRTASAASPRTRRSRRWGALPRRPAIAWMRFPASANRRRRAALAGGQRRAVAAAAVRLRQGRSPCCPPTAPCTPRWTRAASNTSTKSSRAATTGSTGACTWPIRSGFSIGRWRAWTRGAIGDKWRWQPNGVPCRSLAPRKGVRARVL